MHWADVDSLDVVKKCFRAERSFVFFFAHSKRIRSRGTITVECSKEKRKETPMDLFHSSHVISSSVLSSNRATRFMCMNYIETDRPTCDLLFLADSKGPPLFLFLRKFPFASGTKLIPRAE